MNHVVIRPWSPDDDLTALTAMLNRAYAPRDADQSEATTLRRLTLGHAFVAESAGSLVGTLTVYPADPGCDVPLYRDPEACTLGQFGVEPTYQHRGIGSALHRAAVDHARAQGLRWIALGTDSTASDLITMYRRWGYEEAGRKRWENTRSENIILRLAIALF